MDRIDAIAIVGAIALVASAMPASAGDRSVRVTSLQQRWHYLDVSLSPGSLRFFFPDNDVCRKILRRDAEVIYVKRGPLGEVQNEAGERCEPVGIASLRAWRDRSFRPRTQTPVPRSHATFEVVHRDGELAYARGRFILASRVGWTNVDDTIAILPDTQGCQKTIESGIGSIEFRYSGKVPYRLVAGGEDCPIVGFVRPATAEN